MEVSVGLPKTMFVVCANELMKFPKMKIEKNTMNFDFGKNVFIRHLLRLNYQKVTKEFRLPRIGASIVEFKINFECSSWGIKNI